MNDSDNELTEAAPDDEKGEMLAQPAPQQQETAPEAVNLVGEYARNKETAGWLEEQAKKLVQRVQADDESRTDWLQARADEIELFAGQSGRGAGGKNMPQDRVSTRLLLQLWSRGWDQICPAKGSLMQVTPNGPGDEESARKRERHMNWQLRHKVPNWVPGIGESYLQFLMSGSVFREKSWNPVTKTTEFEHLTADDVIVTYARKDSDPMMRRVPRVTRVLHLHQWEIEELADDGAFFSENADKLFDSNTQQGSGIEPSVVAEAGHKIDGVEPPEGTLGGQEDKNLGTRAIYRSHTWLKLPNEKRMKPVIFTVDVKMKIPLSLTIREDDDPFDRMRFEAQKREWELTAQNLQAQYQQALQRWQMAQQQGVPAPEPAQPQPPPPPAPVRQRTIHNMVHYRLFPNPAGFYGIGIAFLLKNANLLINKLEAEYLQAARLANTKGGFLSKGAMGPQRGAVELEMGKWLNTELEPEQLGSGIKEFNFSPPADGLWKFIQQLKSDCNTLIADVDTMSGEAGPTNETKAAAEQRMFNATQLIGVVVRLFLDPLAHEIKLLAHDNRTFLGDNETYYVTEEDHALPQGRSTLKEEISRDDYKDEFEFTFTADQRLQSQPERVQTIANLIIQLAQVPLMQDPARGPAVWYTALLKLFQALDMPEFIRALGQPPQPAAPPPPPTPLDQIDETAGFFNGQDHPVLPDDDDEDHLVKMDDMEKSEYFQQMPPTGKQLFERHKAAHFGQLYKKNAVIHAQAGNSFGLAPGPGMGAGPGDGELQAPAGPAAGGGAPVAPGVVPGGQPQ